MASGGHLEKIDITS